MLGGGLAQRLDGGGADFAIRVGGELGQRLEMRRPSAEVTEGVDRFATDVAIRIGEETFGERADLLAMLREDPEGLDATGRRSGGVFDDRGQGSGRSLFGTSVRERLPGEVRVGGHLGAQAGDEFGGRKLGVVGHGRRDEALRLDAPDTAGLLVAVRVVASDLVVADDLVIPVDHVEAAVRPHRHRDRPEERIVAGDEIVEMLESVAGSFTMLADRVDLRGDRVRDVHHAVVALRPDTDVGERQPAEARAAHLEIRGLDGERRLIGLREAVRAAGIEAILMERHHRVAVVVGFLDERLAFAGQDEAPDIARTDARRLEEAAVRTEARHARAREIGDLSLGRGDLAGIESALREPEPAERRTGELMREEMRILHPEAREQHLAPVGLAVAVGVTEEGHVMAVLDDRAILVRQDAFGNRQALGEGARLAYAGLERLVEDDHLVAGLGLIERLGRRRVLVGIDRVFERGAGPSPALLVEDQHDELAEVGGLLGEELDLETRGQLEELLLLFGGPADALDVIVARVALGGSGLGRLGLLLRRLHLVPGQRAGRGGQLLDRDVLRLHLGHAAGVDLDADLAVGGDIRLGLEIIERRDAVDPAADAIALGEDTVLVPLAFLHGGEHRGRILRVGDDLVATALVVELAVPALAVIDLVAAHLGTVRDAYAAHLHAAVDETRAGQAQFDTQVEVLVGLLRREEKVLRHLRLEGTAADLAFLDAPPGGVALPAGQRLAVEDRHRGGVKGQGEEQSQEATHGLKGLRRR